MGAAWLLERMAEWRSLPAMVWTDSTYTYGDLLDYVITTVLIFYIATIVGRWKLARTNPALAPRSLLDRIVPVLYVAATGYVTVALALYKPTYTVPGLVIVALGVPAFFLFRRTSAGST